MSVARETLKSALKEMNDLEEFAVQNLAEVRRFDFSFFTMQERREIYLLLEELREDSSEHEKLIQIIIKRLSHGQKENFTQPPRNLVGISSYFRP